MTALHTSSPTPQVMNVSAETARGEVVLATVVKRCYRVLRNGTCEPLAEQLPLSCAAAHETDAGRIARDADIYAVKPLTDVVVIGHAYAPPKQASFTAEIQVATATKTLRVTGHRRAERAGGRVLFSEPEMDSAARVPLSCEEAYGGRDETTEARRGIPWADLGRYLPPSFDVRAHSPFVYPRNPWGRGYVIDASDDALRDLLLPRLEDPHHLLTPENLAAGSPLLWPERPLPWHLGWESHGVFPRIGFTGAVRPFEPPSGGFPEARRGFAPADFPKLGPIQAVFDDRFWNGASAGMQLGPFRAGSEEVPFTLRNLHPTERIWSFRLPKGSPKVSVDGREGALVHTTPELSSIVVEPDEDRVSVVWVGRAPAKRRFTLEELCQMPLRADWP